MSWTDDAVAQVIADPTKIRTLFAIAGRKGEEDSRERLLQALGTHLDDELHDLYRFGDANERIAILHATAQLASSNFMTLVRDALRTNDVRLVKAALSTEGLDQLTSDEIDHAVMKCVFMDIPLDSVPALTDHATASTARMLSDFVDERRVAGRDVQPGVFSIIERFEPKG